MSKQKSKSDESFVWEWSSKHTRLRYQLIIVAIVVCSFLRFKVDDGFSVPLFGFDFKTSPSRLEYISIFFGFYIFTLVSFFVRTQNERHELDHSSRLILGAAESVNTHLDRSIDEFLRLRQDIEGIIVHELREIAIAIKQVDINYAQFEQVFFDNSAQILSLIKKLEDLRVGVVDTAQKILRASNFSYTEIGSDEPITIDRSKFEKSFFETGFDAMEENYLIEFEALSKKLQDTTKVKIEENAVSSNIASKKLSELIVLTDKAIQRWEKSLPKQLDKIENIFEKVSTGGHEGLVSFKKATQSLKDEAKKRYDYNRFERELLGFWFPVCVSVGIIIFGFANMADFS